VELFGFGLCPLLSSRGMNKYVHETSDQMAVAAADCAVEAIRDALKARGQANIVLATGASQFGMLEHLVAAEDIDWSRVVMFHLDEYIGPSADHPASFRRYLRERFVDKVGPLKAVHFVQGDAPDPAAECLRLGELIRAYPIDVACVGIGENGHLAFNDPPADFDTQEPYIVVRLDLRCREQQLGEGWFETLEQVPSQAISMSIQQIMKSRRIVVTVPDRRKAQAVRNALEGIVTPLCPASILRCHEDCSIFLDAPAAAMLSLAFEERGRGENDNALIHLPGLVDLQVNGYRGVDFSGVDLTRESCSQACRELLDAGATALLPTVMTSPDEIYERSLPIIADILNEDEFRGRVLGIHLEGPFISPEEGVRGVHDARWIRTPDTAYLERLIHLAQGTIRLVTIAADQPGAEDLARCAVSHGAAVSLGHHAADEHDLERLAFAGAGALTHLGNGVPALLDRHCNPIWAGLANDDLTAMIVADGHHLPAAMLKTIVRAKDPERCIAVSDGSPLAGLPAGDYQSMGVGVRLEESGRLFNPATGYLAGSSATILACANHLLSLGLAGVSELGAMFFYNPLRLLGIRPNQVRDDGKVFIDVKQRRVFVQATDRTCESGVLK
jgi:N-acetylglucosamine-6-phosphate deacetylase/glucosamine-6-phosphate isomerase